jgi:hypothetical protein
MSRLILLLCVLAIGGGVYYWWNHGMPGVILPQSNSAPSAPPAVPPSDSSASAANSTALPKKAADQSASPMFSSPSDVDAAKADVAQKAYALDQAKSVVLASLKTKAEYQSAQGDVDDLQTQVERARAANSPDLADLSAKWIEAKNKVAAMESTAFDTPEIRADQEQLADARRHLGEVQARAQSSKKSVGVPTH